MAAGAAGRVATKQFAGAAGASRHQADSPLRNMPRLDFADENDYAAVAEKLTSDQAKAVLAGLKRQRGYWTRNDLDALRRYCEAEGNAIIYAWKVAALRNKNEPIPIMMTIRDASGDVTQSYGCGGMEKRAIEVAQTEANALGLNKSSRARIVEEVKQHDWLEDVEGLDDSALDTALHETATNILPFAKSG